MYADLTNGGLKKRKTKKWQNWFTKKNLHVWLPFLLLFLNDTMYVNGFFDGTRFYFVRMKWFTQMILVACEIYIKHCCVFWYNMAYPDNSYSGTKFVFLWYDKAYPKWFL